jgi:hypothetical protein
VAVLSPGGTFSPEEIRKQGKAVLLVNNAIHPGEPDGVDASMMLLRDLAGDKKLKEKLANLVLVVVPFYNIGGVLNRNSTTRVNQTGPAEYGFRGNDRNYDLNRDFIKNDTRNARSFAEIYHTWQPDVFVDTHVSNGADYPYVMTLIATQHNKLGGVLGRYLEETFTPRLARELAARKFDVTPYVNPLKETPDSGLVQFMEWPRYSTGYTALFGTLGFMPETHMLKPYDQRVKATYALLQSFVKLVNEEHATLLKLRQETRQAVQAQREFVIDWQLDESRHTPISFKGYAAGHKPSAVSGQPRLYYDRTKPFTKTIPFYNQYVPKTTVQAPGGVRDSGGLGGGGRPAPAEPHCADAARQRHHAGRGGVLHRRLPNPQKSLRRALPALQHAGAARNANDPFPPGRPAGVHEPAGQPLPGGNPGAPGPRLLL